MPIKIMPSIPTDRKGLKLLIAIKRDMLGYFVRLMRHEGSYAWLSLGGRKVLMLNDAKGIEHVFRNNAENYKKSYFYRVLKPLLGNSLLLTEGNIWKKQRRESSPAFATRNFDEMSAQMADSIEAMFSRWAPRISAGESLDLNFETMLFTLDVLLRTLFHETKEDIASRMQVAITTLLREAEERVWAPVNLPQWLTFKLPKYKKALGFLDTTIHELVAARKANEAYPDDLLSRLIASYGQTEEQKKYLRDQVMTFLLAGHETTANGLVWACYYLSQRPEIWYKMEDEVDRVLIGRAPTFQDLKDLIYTRQVFDEVLRFHPIVWTMSRDAIGDDSIPLENGDEIFVPEGTVVQLCTFAVHRREKYWDNPEAFDPGRFNPDVTSKRPAYAYFPFGGGPRQCLGIRFALIESVLALAMMAQRYRLALVPGQNIHALPNITLRPNGPVHFRLAERKQTSKPDVTALAEKPVETTTSKCPFPHAA